MMRGITSPAAVQAGEGEWNFTDRLEGVLIEDANLSKSFFALYFPVETI